MDYKQEMKDHKTTEGPLKDSHWRLVNLEEEHSRIKRKLIDLKNGKEDVEFNQAAEIVKAVQMSTDSYKKHQETEMRRHMTSMGKLEDEKNRLDEEILRVMVLIEEKENENWE